MHEVNFLTTHVGSVPHTSDEKLTMQLVDTLDIPAWPQLPKRDFKESMYVQYSANLPAIKIDEINGKIYFDTTVDMAAALEKFYQPILEDDVDAFRLNPDYARGYYHFLESLRKKPGIWVKGQVTGPISFGLTVTDQGLRASLYDDQLCDVIVKNAAMHARWQARQFKALRPNVIIFTDEPYLASFGSAFINLSREQVTNMLDEVFSAIHSEGGLAGVHCCANTDWGLLLTTQVDVLNLDAYGYLENLSLYPAELRSFLDRGGIVCWGIVPNSEDIRKVTANELAKRLRIGLKMIADKAKGRGVQIKMDDFIQRSLISPACGMGSTSVEICDEVFNKLVLTGEILKKG